MGGRRKGMSGASWALLAAGFVAGAALVVVALMYMGFERPAPVAPTPGKVAPSYAPGPPVDAIPPEPPAPEPPQAKPAPTVRPPLPKLAIVIDDMGPDLRKLRELVALGEPVTVAVMPHMRYSREVSAEAGASGLDVIVHMPMEPRDSGGHNPGSDALLVAMTSGEIASRFDAGLKTVPGAIGINNHMGSRFTENEQKMRTVLGMVRDRGMIFLDSRTSPETVGLRVARQMSVRSAERSVFLDNERDVEYIKGQLREAARMARRKGRAVAIGHPYPETIRALREALPGLEGVEIVRLSEIVE